MNLKKKIFLALLAIGITAGSVSYASKVTKEEVNFNIGKLIYNTYAEKVDFYGKKDCAKKDIKSCLTKYTDNLKQPMYSSRSGASAIADKLLKFDSFENEKEQFFNYKYDQNYTNSISPCTCFGISKHLEEKYAKKPSKKLLRTIALCKVFVWRELKPYDIAWELRLSLEGFSRSALKYFKNNIDKLIAQAVEELLKCEDYRKHLKMLKNS